MNNVRTRALVTFLAALALMIPMLACGNVEEIETDDDDTVEPADETETADEETGGGGGAVCDRVAGCCRAYVAAMGAGMPASTCDAYNNVEGMPDATCESTMSGYRSGLTALNHDIPSECAEQ